MEEQIEDVARQLYPFALKPEQLQAIKYISEMNNVIVNLPVGFGKSIIFHILPRLFEKLGRECRKVLVISPLNTIMREQREKMEKIDIVAVQLNQNCSIVKNDTVCTKNVIKECENCDVILTHPEALFEADNGIKLLRSLEGKVGAIIIDECHKVDEWGKEFRRSFTELVTLKSFFSNAPYACLSGTLTPHHIRQLSKQLFISNFKVISVSPDKRNVKLNVIEKPKGSEYDRIEKIYREQTDCLQREGSGFPVTLVFLPLEYIAHAMMYAYQVFGGKDKVNIDNALFGCLFSNQDKDVLDCIISDLQNEQPRFRLVFTTTIVGMGFDPPSVAHVVHCKPPRCITNYLQEIGRAGRRGQPATATLYYSNRDIGKNLPGIQEDIIQYCKHKSCYRECLLSYFGYEKSVNSPEGCLCCSYCSTNCTCENCLLAKVVDNLNL